MSVTSAIRPGPACWALLLACGCGPQDDVVFSLRSFQLLDRTLSVLEGAGITPITLRLAQATDRVVAANYQVVRLEAQDDCQAPDFKLASGRVEWPAGTTEASIDVYIGDDELAETDERFQVALTDVSGAEASTESTVDVVIRDDDNTGVVDAALDLGATVDQAPRLQAALDQATALGRGLVLVSPGDYAISSVSMAPGTTLSGRGVRFHRPPLSPADTVTVRVAHSGADDSAITLIEGLSVDGHRDEQGPYRNSELVDTNVISWLGDAAQVGRVRGSVEGVTARAGTGSAVYVGPNADVDVCHLVASDMWRDALTLRGGGSSLRVRGLDASALDGTTGVWLGGNNAGYAGTRRIDVEVEDVRLGTGDVEIEALAGSSVVLRRLSMTQGPLRLVAPEGRVRIFDSVLVGGIPSMMHNFWDSPSDVEVTGTTLIAAEQTDDSVSLREADRVLSAIRIRWDSRPVTPPHLLFDRCRFERASDVEAADTVYAVDNPVMGATVVVRSSALGAGVSDWFAPGCKGCTLEP